MAHARDLGVYLEDLGQNRVARPSLALPLPLLKQVRQAQATPEEEPSALKSELTVPSSVEWVGAYWPNSGDEPVLLVRTPDQQILRLRVGRELHYAAAAENILRLLKVPLLPRKFVTRLDVQISAKQKADLALFLTNLPVRLRWSDQFEETMEGLKVKAGFLEPLPQLSGQWSWEQVQAQPQYARMLLGLAWLNCNLIDPNSDHRLAEPNATPVVVNFSRCLGMTASVASPNLLLDSWGRLQQGKLILDNPFRDDSYRLALEALSPEQTLHFVRAASKLPLPQLISAFLQAGFPQSLATLFALKLNQRLQSVATLLHEPVASPKKAKDFSAPPEIIDGRVVQDYPDFPVDLTQNAMEQLLWELGKAVLKPVDELARAMLHSLPFISFEVAEIGRAHFAPGFMFRMHRSVDENPNPTGGNDAYLVRDELEVMVTAGIGIDKDIRVGSAWANLGPGYVRKYVHISPASSRQQARENYWSIPYDLIWRLNFETIPAGEVLAIQGGWVGAFVAGGTLLRGQLIRPSGYVMESYQNLRSFQAARLPSGAYILAQGHDHRWHTQIKGFWRVYNRYFRIPFASWSRDIGSRQLESVTLDDKRLSNLGDWSRLKVFDQVQAALARQDIGPLTQSVHFKRSKRDYDATSFFYNLFYWTGASSSASSTVQVDGHLAQLEISRRKYNHQNHLVDGKPNFDCQAQAVLVRTGHIVPQDGYAKIYCELEVTQLHSSQIKHQLNLLNPFRLLGLNIPFAADRLKADFHSRYKLELPWSAIAPMVLDGPATGWYADALEQLKKEVDARLQLPGNQGLQRFHFFMKLEQIRSMKTPRKRLDHFLSFLTDSMETDPIFFRLHESLPGKFEEWSWLDQWSMNSNALLTRHQRGEMVQSSARNLMDSYFEPFENLVVDDY
jgi:hypothetical protein